MGITKAELDRRKKLAEAILKAKGEVMNDHLGELYQEIINSNVSTIEKALKNYTTNNQSNHYQGGNR